MSVILSWESTNSFISLIKASSTDDRIQSSSENAETKSNEKVIVSRNNKMILKKVRPTDNDASDPLANSL